MTALPDKVHVLEKKLISGSHALLTIDPKEVREAAHTIKGSLEGAMGETVVGVDLMNNRYELIYYLWSLTKKVLLEVRTQVEGETPTIDSVTDIFPGLDWHEREIHEMFGIVFNGHPNLSLLILPDELEGKYPLRKSFQVSRERLKESGITGPVAKPVKTTESNVPAVGDKAAENE